MTYYVLMQGINISKKENTERLLSSSQMDQQRKTLKLLTYSREVNFWRWLERNSRLSQMDLKGIVFQGDIDYTCPRQWNKCYRMGTCWFQIHLWDIFKVWWWSLKPFRVFQKAGSRFSNGYIILQQWIWRFSLVAHHHWAVSLWPFYSADTNF